MTQRAPWAGSYLRLLFEPMASRCVCVCVCVFGAGVLLALCDTRARWAVFLARIYHTGLLLRHLSWQLLDP